MSTNDNTFSVENAEDSSGFLLWQVTNLWQREIRKILEPYDLTHSQFVLMACIHWLTLKNELVTQIILSTHTKIDPMTTSTVLRTLQTKGFVKRIEHPTDTRSKIVTITESGKEIIKKAVVSVELFDTNFFASVKKNNGNFNNQLLQLLDDYR